MPTQILSDEYTAIKKAHSAATTAKTFLLLNGKVVLPLNTELANVENVFAYRIPRAKAPKATGEAWTALGRIYWDDTAKKFTTTATANTFAGYIVSDAASADTEGEIHLNPSPLAAAIVSLTDSTTGTANDTLVDVGAAFNQATLNSNFADLAAKVNAILTALRAAGTIAP